MRVLLNTKPLVLSDKTGVGYYVLRLYQELKRCGIDVVPTLSTGSQAFVNSISKVSFHLRRLFPNWPPAFVRQIGDFFIGSLLRGNIDEPAYDIYHETSLDIMPETTAKKILNIYDLSFIICPEFLVKDFTDNARTNVIRNAHRADRVIVNTEFIKGEVIDILNLPDWKIDVIPLAPVHFYDFNNRSVLRPEVVRSFTSKDYILYVGTVEPRKNLKTLIKAFKEIRRKYDISLIIAGRLGWLYDDIIAYPQTLNIEKDVIFTRYIDEEILGNLYNHAVAFVYPSLYEGFGLPPLEAMACRIPVIISDIPPLREVAGDAAITFNPKDHGELVSAVDRVLSSDLLRSEMVRRGIKKAKEYSWGRVADLTIKTYKRVLEG